MERDFLLKGIKVLLVDDEPDVLEILEEDLTMCGISKATSFDEAKEMLETQDFDFAVLDIMGVNGYKLLEMANQRNVTALILTAHALSPEDALKSHKEGAASYIPKGKIGEIRDVLNDILQARQEGKSSWWRWHERFGAYFEKIFGAEWTDQKDFLREIHKDKWEKYF